VALEEILAEVLNRGVNAASLRKEYRRLVEAAGSELALLMDMDLEELERISTQRLACAVRRVRRGEINIRPGFDGEYGKIKIFADAQPPPGPAQMGLFKQGRQ
jgi:PHP family Zn ribbon phosphoesterase